MRGKGEVRGRKGLQRDMRKLGGNGYICHLDCRDCFTGVYMP